MLALFQRAGRSLSAEEPGRGRAQAWVDPTGQETPVPSSPREFMPGLCAPQLACATSLEAERTERQHGEERERKQLELKPRTVEERNVVVSCRDPDGAADQIRPVDGGRCRHRRPSPSRCPASRPESNSRVAPAGLERKSRRRDCPRRPTSRSRREGARGEPHRALRSRRPVPRRRRTRGHSRARCARSRRVRAGARSCAACRGSRGSRRRSMPARARRRARSRRGRGRTSPALSSVGAGRGGCARRAGEGGLRSCHTEECGSNHEVQPIASRSVDGRSYNARSGSNGRS